MRTCTCRTMFFNFSVEEEAAQGSSSFVHEVQEDSDKVKHGRSSAETRDCSLKFQKDADVHISATIVTVKDWHRNLVARLHTPPSLYSIPGSEIKLMYIDFSHIPEIVADSKNIDNPSGLELKSLLQLSDSYHSDLIPETSVDLVGKSVLELGCGAGLPAIFSLVSGAECVHFQDYNSEVLDYITIPSIICNDKNFGTNQIIENRCQFYSGDWNHLPSLLTSEQCYDVILTSETIYYPSSQPQLLSTLKERSRVATGVVFVAAKCVYFGVGGTVKGFCSLVEEEGTFDVGEVWRVRASVPRVILKLTHRESKSPNMVV